MVTPFVESGFFDPDKPIKDYTEKERHDLLYKQTIEGQGQGHQRHLRRADPEDPQVDVQQGRRLAAAAHQGVRRAGRGLQDLSGLRRQPAQRGGALLEDQRPQHRRRVRHAGHRRGRVAARHRRQGRGAAGRQPAAPLRLVRRDRPGLPLARPPLGHAVRRRGAAHEDGPPHRVRADRRHLRLRRADDRPAPARHRADEQPAPRAARQGQHRARRRAQAGDDRDRRPRRRPRPRGGHRRRHDLLRGDRRGAEGVRHPHRPSPRPPDGAQGHGPDADRHARDPRRGRAQPAGRRRRRPARRALRRDRRGRLRQVARSSTGRSPTARAWCRSTRARSTARAGATPRRTRACSTRSAPRSRRPTA